MGLRVFLFSIPVVTLCVVGGGWLVAAEWQGTPAAEHVGHEAHEDREIRLSDGTNILNEECGTPDPGKPQSDSPPPKNGL